MIQISELTLQEKIGQMFIVGIDKDFLDDKIKSLILDYKIGGVILYKKNFHNYSSMINIINELNNISKRNKISLFISVDQEGGKVNRMPKEIKNILNAKTLSATKDIRISRRSGKRNWRDT